MGYDARCPPPLATQWGWKATLIIINRTGIIGRILPHKRLKKGVDFGKKNG
jgi:N-acetylglutamate synthase/N-acetylornithine aminotransferase